MHRPRGDGLETGPSECAQGRSESAPAVAHCRGPSSGGPSTKIVTASLDAGRPSGSAPRRWPAGKALPHFTIARTFGEFPRGIGGQYLPPKGDRARVAQVLDDFPFAGKPVENQGCGALAYSLAAVWLADEKFRHMKIDGTLARRRDARPGDQGEPNRIRALEYHQGMGLIVREPIREYFVFVRIVGPQHGKQAGIEIGERIEVLTVNILDPLAILLGLLTVANTDQQGRHSPRPLMGASRQPSQLLSLKDTARGDEPSWPSARACEISVKRITASELPQPKLRKMLHRQQRWRRRLNPQRRTRPNPRRAAACFRSWEQEPRSCCRRHSAPVQRQKRLLLVWSSSIDTPGNIY